MRGREEDRLRSDAPGPGSPLSAAQVLLWKGLNILQKLYDPRSEGHLTRTPDLVIQYISCHIARASNSHPLYLQDSLPRQMETPRWGVNPGSGTVTLGKFVLFGLQFTQWWEEWDGWTRVLSALLSPLVNSRSQCC